MIKDTLKITLRGAFKRRTFTLINVVGLATGLTAFILIALYVQYERSYDEFYPNSERVHRVVITSKIAEQKTCGALTPAPLAKEAVENVEGVETATRILHTGYPVIRANGKAISEELFFRVDSNFFEIFPQRVIAGDDVSPLGEVGEMAITESAAIRYFGSAENAVGEIMTIDHMYDVRVTAVLADPPQNTHFQFEFLLQNDAWKKGGESWFGNMFHTYLLLEPDADPEAIEERVNRWAHVRMAESAELMLGVTYDELAKRFSEYEFALQPLESVHLNSRLQYELGENGDGRYLSLFELIALAILLVSLANFTNLATARSSTRALEIGVRKTLGADRLALLKQFFVESVSLSLIAAALAAAVVSVALPFFNEFVEKPLAYEPLTDWRHALLTLALAVLAGVVAGAYPALALSAFKPADALRGGVAVGRKRAYFRSALVVGQFVVSIALIAAAFVAFSQADYLREKDLGFQKDRLLVIQKTDDLMERQNQFKREIVDLPNVVAATKLNAVPGHTFPGYAWRLAGYEDYERLGAQEIADSLAALRGVKFEERDRSVVTFWTIHADEDFLETFGARLREGRFFQPGSAWDSSDVVLNETAVNTLGEEFGVGATLVQSGDKKRAMPLHEVVGVVEDFHFESLYEPIRPMALNFGSHPIHGKVIVARLGKGDAEETIAQIEQIWSRLQKEQRFEYFFFDEEFARIHRAELRLGVIAGMFSVLAIFVASLGLLGLAAYSAERRSKEIGVRKALGASATALVARLVGEYVVWTLIATVIAAPLSYYAFERWLSQFPNHIALSPAPFLLAAGLALLIAAAVVVSQALRAALDNPVNALRYE